MARRASHGTHACPKRAPIVVQTAPRGAQAASKTPPRGHHEAAIGHPRHPRCPPPSPKFSQRRP
eukprot:9497019-Pyramimonas_sp.AAC.2